MYTVYSLKFPDGTRFVGLTNRPFSTVVGWKGRSLKGQNTALHDKVQEFGWENVQWNVLAENLDKDTAYDIRNAHRSRYMEQGIWFKERKKQVSATDVLAMYEKELCKRINERIAELFAMDVANSELEYIRDEVVPEVTVEVYHLLERR